ncbi:MAG: hypothetical protein R2724_25785 [Bryobacterales bacterium]
MMRAGLAVAMAAMLAAAGLSAATEGAQDVSHPLTTMLVSRQAEAHRVSANFKAQVEKRELVLEDRGDIAIVDDGDGVGLEAFPFDLNGRSVEILPQAELAAAYTYQAHDGGYDVQAAATGSFVTLGDDDAVLLPIGFAFPYFGQTWEQVYVHSDGHLTFGEPDLAQTARDAPRAVSGPPRIAAFFWDLNPSEEGRRSDTWRRLTV